MQDREKRKILLIDDDTSLLVTLRDFLLFEGYEVATADSGEQGLKRLETFLPDLIVLDMSMPGMGGIGFLQRITRSDGAPRYPVLVLTARASMAEFFANVSVDGFIAKPCDPEDLLSLRTAEDVFLVVERVPQVAWGYEGLSQIYEALLRSRFLNPWLPGQRAATPRPRRQRSRHSDQVSAAGHDRRRRGRTAAQDAAYLRNPRRFIRRDAVDRRRNGNTRQPNLRAQNRFFRELGGAAGSG